MICNLCPQLKACKTGLPTKNRNKRSEISVSRFQHFKTYESDCSMLRATFTAWVSPMVAVLGCVSPGGIAAKGTDRFKRCLTETKLTQLVISMGLCPCICVCVCKNLPLSLSDFLVFALVIQRFGRHVRTRPIHIHHHRRSRRSRWLDSTWNSNQCKRLSDPVLKFEQSQEYSLMNSSCTWLKLSHLEPQH